MSSLTDNDNLRQAHSPASSIPRTAPNSSPSPCLIIIVVVVFVAVLLSRCLRFRDRRKLANLSSSCAEVITIVRPVGRGEGERKKDREGRFIGEREKIVSPLSTQLYAKTKRIGSVCVSQLACLMFADDDSMCYYIYIYIYIYKERSWCRCSTCMRGGVFLSNYREGGRNLG